MLRYVDLVVVFVDELHRYLLFGVHCQYFIRRKDRPLDDVIEDNFQNWLSLYGQ